MVPALSSTVLKFPHFFPASLQAKTAGISKLLMIRLVPSFKLKTKYLYKILTKICLDKIFLLVLVVYNPLNVLPKFLLFLALFRIHFSSMRFEPHTKNWKLCYFYSSLEFWNLTSLVNALKWTGRYFMVKWMFKVFRR